MELEDSQDYYFRIVAVDKSGNSSNPSDGQSALANLIAEANIADATITTAKIGEAQITNALIADATITSAKINDLTADKITAGTIDASVITVTNLDASNITAGTLDANTVTISNLTVDVGDISNLNFSSLGATSQDIINTLATNAILSTIGNGAISQAKLGTLTVDVANVSNLNFSSLGATSQDIINTIAENAILAKIGDGQISEQKLGNISASKITSGTIDAGRISTSSLASVFINTSANITSALTVQGQTVKASGNVLTGDRLEHNGASNTYIDIGQTSQFTFRPNGTSTGLSLSATGSSFIRSHWKPNLNNTYDLGSSGLRWDDIYTNGSVNTSDITLKTDVENTTLGLNFLNTLEPIEYKWADGGVRTHLGFSAQDVKQKLIDYAGEDQNYALYTQGSYAESVDEVDEEGNLIEDLPEDFESFGLRYDELIPVLVKAIQELTARIEVLEG